MKLKAVLLVAGFSLLAACADKEEDADVVFITDEDDVVFIEDEYEDAAEFVAEEVEEVEDFIDDLEGTVADFMDNVGPTVLFAYDSSDLSMEARNTLSNQADWLNRFPEFSVTVEGHCDERGTREYNLALGERRANAVRDYLVSEGVSTFRIETLSRGEEFPAVVGSGEDVWSFNRRAVTQLSDGI